MELNVNSDRNTENGCDNGHDDDDDNDDDAASYLDTDRMMAVFNITEPEPSKTLSPDIEAFNNPTASDSEEEYLAVRKLVLYGML